MHKCGCDEHACPEVSRDEEGVVRNRQAREAPDYYREGARGCAEGENEDEGKDVERGVVGVMRLR